MGRDRAASLFGDLRDFAFQPTPRSKSRAVDSMHMSTGRSDHPESWRRLRFMPFGTSGFVGGDLVLVEEP